MSRRIQSIVRKEFIHVVRDPQTLALVLAMPIMQLLLFGYAINSTVDHIRLVVSDEARTADSRGIVQALVNSTFFDLTGYVDSPAQAQFSPKDAPGFATRQRPNPEHHWSFSPICPHRIP